MGDFPAAALITGALGLVVAIVAFVFGRKSGRAIEIDGQRRARATADETAGRIVDEAKREAENLRKGAVVAGKEEILQLRESIEQEVRQRRSDIEREEKRVMEREGQIDRVRDSLEGRDQELQKRTTDLGRRETKSSDRESELERMVEDERRRLEQLAGLSADEAKAELMRRMEDTAMADAASRLREIRETTKRNADREARKIVALEIGRAHV